LSNVTSTQHKHSTKSGQSQTAAARVKGRPRRRAGPGRPEGVSNVRDEILDAAEIEFADGGYTGTSLRNVAERAKVTQALINYYFGSKHRLFREVYTRRGNQISDQRMESFAQLRKSDKPLKIRDVIEAFLLPALRMREMPGGRTFMRLNARLHTEPPEISYKLRTEVYDKSTRIFAETLREAFRTYPRKMPTGGRRWWSAPICTRSLIRIDWISWRRGSAIQTTTRRYSMR
jgi:AcrR family transcriptional regulator